LYGAVIRSTAQIDIAAEYLANNVDFKPMWVWPGRLGRDKGNCPFNETLLKPAIDFNFNCPMAVRSKSDF